MDVHDQPHIQIPQGSHEANAIQGHKTKIGELAVSITQLKGEMKKAEGIAKLWNFLGVGDKAKELKTLQKALLDHSDSLQHLKSGKSIDTKDLGNNSSEIDKKISELEHELKEAEYQHSEATQNRLMGTGGKEGLEKASQDMKNLKDIIQKLEDKIIHLKSYQSGLRAFEQRGEQPKIEADEKHIEKLQSILQRIGTIKKSAQSSIISRIALFLGKGEAKNLEQARLEKQDAMMEINTSRIGKMLLEDAAGTNLNAPLRGREKGGVGELGKAWTRECDKLGITKLIGPVVDIVIEDTKNNISKDDSKAKRQQLAFDLLKGLISKLKEGKGSAIQELSRALHVSVCEVQKRQNEGKVTQSLITDPKAFVILTFFLRTICPMILMKGREKLKVDELFEKQKKIREKAKNSKEPEKTTLTEQANKIGKEIESLKPFQDNVNALGGIFQSEANTYNTSPEKMSDEFKSLLQELEEVLLPPLSLSEVVNKNGGNKVEALKDLAAQAKQLQLEVDKGDENSKEKLLDIKKLIQEAVVDPDYKTAIKEHYKGFLEVVGEKRGNHQAAQSLKFREWIDDPVMFALMIELEKKGDPNNKDPHAPNAEYLEQHMLVMQLVQREIDSKSEPLKQQLGKLVEMFRGGANIHPPEEALELLKAAIAGDVNPITKQAITMNDIKDAMEKIINSRGVAELGNDFQLKYSIW